MADPLYVTEAGPIPAGTNTIGAVNSQQGTGSALNMTAATLVKASAGRLARISVLVAGTGVGSANDAASVAAAAAANQVFVIPTTVGVYLIDWPCASGIVVTPGAGQTLAVSFI